MSEPELHLDAAKEGECLMLDVWQVPASLPFALSERALDVAALFDVEIDDGFEQPSPARRTRCRIPLPRGGILFITGPSGSGKSTFLRRIAGRVQSTTITQRCSDDPGFENRPVIDCFDGMPLDRALAHLSRAGLAEARLLLRPAGRLSDGERFRLQLALAFAQADRHDGSSGTPDPLKRGGSASSARAILLCDEFCAPLDRITARGVAANVRRWISTTNHTLIAASAHDDLLESLNPDVLIAASLQGGLAVHPRPGLREIASADPDQRAADQPEGLSIEDGSMGDFDALARFHYRAGRPATIERVFRMLLRRPTVVGRFLSRRGETQTVGALVRSFPTLSCAMRDEALGGRYRGLAAARRARIINAEFRTISRVVIDPRLRGGGLASRLVRHALLRPATPCTEALAAMGRVHPFFERAGMQRFEARERPEDLRILAAMEHAGIGSGQARDLVLPARLASRIDALAEPMRGWVRTELNRWRATCRESQSAKGAGAHSSPGNRISSDDVLVSLRLARRRIVSRPVYFLATHEGR